MATWLSGGLNQFSNITGQISSFTKEVLTETTEEVTDPTAELQVLRQKYDELGKSHQFLETELQKSKEHSDEQKERAETAEYQIATISQEYRKLVESRDAEIRQLKTESAKLREEAKVHHSSDPHSPLKELAELQFIDSHQLALKFPVGAGGNYRSVDGEEWVQQYDEDFSDVISSQAEINHLRSKLAQVRAELQHWKSVAEDDKGSMPQVMAETSQNQHQESMNNHKKENLKVHIDDMQVKILDQQCSIATLQQEYERSKQETKHLQEQVGRLSVQLHEKEKEISDLREKLGDECVREDCSSDKCGEEDKNFTVINRDKGGGEEKERECVTVSSSAEVETLKAETNSLKDLQLLLEAKIRQKDSELNNVAEKFQVLQRENLSLRQQLASLKDHLIEIQRGHAQKQLKADQKENEQLDDLQLKLTQKLQQLDHLERELQVVREERDDALLKMANAQEQANMNAESIKNLQTVLEQFQRDQSSELGQALKSSQLQLADALEGHQQLVTEFKSVKEQLEEARAAAQVSSILNQELEEKESKYALILKENERLQSLLQESQHRVEKLSSQEKTMVDRNLVKNMVLGYIHATDHKKTEVLHLMSKILEFTGEEVEQAVGGHTKGKGWLAGLWKTTPTSEPQPSDLAPTSLSQLFIKFLESESTSRSLKDTTGHQAVAGYVDSLTDPDKPSLSTASLLGSVKQLEQEHNKPVSTNNTVQSSQTQSVSLQSSLLKSVLTD